MIESKRNGRSLGTIAAAVVLAMGLSLLLAGAGMAAGSAGSSRAAVDAGWGAATIVANLFYVPCKVLYAVAGATAGTVAYAASGGNRETADKVWVLSIGGDYVLTADMVAGRQEIQFSGRPGD